MTECPSDRIVSRAAARNATGSRDVAVPTKCANTPRGMLRADSVPATHCTRTGSACVTKRASVVLPTPASPTRTMPQTPCTSTSADWMVAYSLSRATTGQLLAIARDVTPARGSQRELCVCESDRCSVRLDLRGNGCEFAGARLSLNGGRGLGHRQA